MDDPPITDAYLRSVTIGERKPLNSTIHLAPYDPDWPDRFEFLASKVRKALGRSVRLLEHVGSTSVRGLRAKPVIDIVLAVPDAADEPAYVPPLEAYGFLLRCREPDWFQHRFLKTPESDGHLHVFSEGCPEIDRMLAFRDRLRTHPSDRAVYEEEKTRLAGQVWSDLAYYADAKSDIIESILSKVSIP